MLALSKHQCQLGEGAYWHPIAKKLYWVDIKAHQIHYYDPLSFKSNCWQLPGLVSVICGVKKSNKFIIGYEDKIAEFDPKFQSIKILFDTQTGKRMNDGYVDPKGRFWIGQVDDNQCGLGKLYRYDSTGQCQVMEEGLFTSNGLDWDLKRKRFYLTDSRMKTIYIYDYDVLTGNIKNRRTFIKVSEDEGSPDGMILDAEGYLWVCFWNGSKIVRYSPEGSVSRIINLSISRPTKCIFWGDTLKKLFITSASSNVHTHEQLEPPNGYSFITDVDVFGVTPTLFGAN